MIGQGERRSGLNDRRQGSAPYVRNEAGEELLVVKEGALFVCTRPDGDIGAVGLSGEGLYARDTRHLSELALTLGGRPLVVLSANDAAGHRAVVDATNSELFADGEVAIGQQTVAVRRTMSLDGDRLELVIGLRNFGPTPLSTTLELSLAADFADMFEVRGSWDLAQGRAQAVAEAGDGELTLSHEGRDGRRRTTAIAFDRVPDHLRAEGAGGMATWSIVLEPGDEDAIVVMARPSTTPATAGPAGATDGEPAGSTLAGRGAPGGDGRPGRSAPAGANAAGSDGAVERSYRAFANAATQIDSASETFDRILAASTRDLRALVTPLPGANGAEVVAAGIPWYVCPFGRDSLLTCLESLLLNADLARTTLLALAGLQSTTDNAWRDAEPGKILHELRAGELAGAGLVPHSPYYGTIDATPLFVMLAAAYWRWTADRATLEALRPALDAALHWIDEHGDRDGDGFVEYERRSEGGILNQGWKDSGDAMVHADGSLAEGPIALVEAQGYVYLAKARIADVYEALGAADRAQELRREAEALRRAIDAAYWMPDEGFPALALDGAKRQLRSVTSNAGHLLYCDALEPGRADAVSERLMAPDMFSGWGVRTLSSQSPAYNPMSYHNGSIWPHDNAIIAAGLKRAGHPGATIRIATALLEVAAGTRDLRLPELYCGFERGAEDAPVAYPVACSPQAWAAAAPFMVLQAMLGLSPRAGEQTLNVIRPSLPPWLERVALRELRVGGARVSLAFHRDGEVTGFSMQHQTGPLEVTMAT